MSVKIHICDETKEDMEREGFTLVGYLPPAATQGQVNNVVAQLGPNRVWFTRHSNGKDKKILVWTSDAFSTDFKMPAPPKPEPKAMRTIAISGLTSFACEVIAFVFFFWCDWRIAVGYGFIWLAEMNIKSAIPAFKAAMKNTK